MAPELSKAAIGLNPLIGTYAVDCDDEKNKKLCSQQVSLANFVSCCIEAERWLLIGGQRFPNNQTISQREISSFHVIRSRKNDQWFLQLRVKKGTKSCDFS